LQLKASNESRYFIYLTNSIFVPMDLNYQIGY
jgi:hypothetical protein